LGKVGVWEKGGFAGRYVVGVCCGGLEYSEVAYFSDLLGVLVALKKLQDAMSKHLGFSVD
jgi:hypothetical protein